jgi:hypothetical protein
MNDIEVINKTNISSSLLDDLYRPSGLEPRVSTIEFFQF